MTPDLINAFFEGLASVMILNHCRVLLKQKRVRGVSVLSTIFFFSWGVWNLFYYNHLGQTFSWVAGMSVLIANGLWIGLMLYFKSRNG